MIDEPFRTLLWRQFGAAIDSLENAINACPESLWGDRTQKFEFWYWVSHTLFWLDFYLHDVPEPFHPPAPFGLEELESEGVMPPRVYTKVELLTYLSYLREKCRKKLAALTEEQMLQKCEWNPYKSDFSVFELHLYNMRHVQHHTAQLNLILRQQIDSAPKWVSRAKINLTDK